MIATDKQVDILVVEDNIGDFVLIDEYLKEHDAQFRVDHATSYQKARHFLQDNHQDYDAILLDLTLPDKSGEELIEKVVSMEGSASTIVLTGYSDMEFSVKSLNMGVSDYLLKDELTPGGLWKSVRYSIERKAASVNLKESEERYRVLFQNNPSPMLVWNSESGGIIDVNREAQIKYGYSKSEFIELGVEDIQIDGFDYGDLSPENGLNKLSTGVRHVWRHKKKNGDIFFAEVNWQPLYDYRNEQSSLMIIHDVSEKIELQEKMIEGAIRAEEEERNRISKELHDSIVQQMVACGMFAQNLQEKVGNEQELRQEIDRLYHLIKEITHETRDLSHNLKPAEFEISSLDVLLKQLARQLSKESGIRFTVNFHLPEGRDIDTYIKTHLYRILQELSLNEIKHSSATEVVINLEEVDGRLYITLQDDGTGFDVDGKETEGIGLRNVRSRLYRLGGSIEFKNLANKGLQINIEIPV